MGGKELNLDPILCQAVGKTIGNNRPAHPGPPAAAPLLDLPTAHNFLSTPSSAKGLEGLVLSA